MELLQSVCKFQWGLWHALDELEPNTSSSWCKQREKKYRLFLFPSWKQECWKPREMSLFPIHSLKALDINWSPPKYILLQLKKVALWSWMVQGWGQWKGVGKRQGWAERRAEQSSSDLTKRKKETEGKASPSLGIISISQSEPKVKHLKVIRALETTDLCQGQ